ncbi:MAG: alpha/beta hydrolase [Cyclobacteriaceae bacterium]|nr:alpha/beta fold hydrolase [Cyclobacteriaceae bacterium]MCH8517358.1 alpha/beta hydrolase [Cyclobacteriaceae bacterium]
MLYHKKYIHPTSKEWVTFIHGAGGSSSIWFRQLKDFRAEYNVLLVDLRGHGKSADIIHSYISNNYSFELIAQDVVDVLDHLQIEKSHFVGISLGTIIVRSIAEIAPSRVSKMVLGGAVTRFDLRSRFLVRMGHLVKKLVPFMWLYKLFAFVILPRKAHAHSRNLFIKDAKRVAQAEFMRWFKLTRDVNPLWKYFREKELNIPILYIMGDQDHMFLPPVRQMASEHTFSDIKVIDDCGHVCNVDKPEAFNKLSIDFLKS